MKRNIIWRSILISGAVLMTCGAMGMANQSASAARVRHSSVTRPARTHKVVATRAHVARRNKPVTRVSHAKKPVVRQHRAHKAVAKAKPKAKAKRKVTRKSHAKRSKKTVRSHKAYKKVTAKKHSKKNRARQPKLEKPISKVRTTTQKRSALRNVKYYRSVKKHNNYPLAGTWHDQTVPETDIADYSNNYGHYKETILNVNNNAKDSFKTFAFLPTRIGKKQFFSPQSIVVSPDGHYAFVGYNATNSNKEGAYANLKPGVTEIVKYDLRHFKTVHQTPEGVLPGEPINDNEPVTIDDSTYSSDDNSGSGSYDDAIADLISSLTSPQNGNITVNNPSASQSNNPNGPVASLSEPTHAVKYAKVVKVGPLFYGGHGQAMNYNPRNNTLWLLNNLEGASDDTSIELISQRNLNPIHMLKFHLNTILGDSLVFDGRGHMINFDEAESANTITKLHAMKVFTGSVSPYSINLRMVQGIAKAPGEIIQAAAFNPKNKRIYVVSDNSIISFPAYKLGHLRKADFKQVMFNGSREFEGLSFDRHGRAYLLCNRSPEILVCDRL